MRQALLLVPLLLVSCIDTTVNSNNSDPEAVILEPAPDFSALLGDNVTFVGNVDDGPTATSDLEVTWSSSVNGTLFDGEPDTDGETSFSTDALDAGEHTITLRVVDPQGASDTDAITITIEEPQVENTVPTCAITAPEDDAEVGEGDTVVFEGTADDEQSAPTELLATWTSSEDDLLGSSAPSSSGALALPVSDLSPGTHVITLDVEDPEGLNCSEFIIVTVIPDNYPPSIGAPTVTPDPLFTSDDATCVAGTPTDPEGDTVSVELRWLVEGLDPGVAGGTLASAFFSKGETVACTATPSDATGVGATMTSTALVVSDTPPTAPAVALSPAAPIEGTDSLTCSITAGSTDADNDGVTYAVSWTVGGVPYTGSTATTSLAGDTIAVADLTAGDWVCTVTPTAAGLAGPPGSASVTVTPANQPPTVGAPTVSPSPLFTDDTASCSAPTPVDPEGDPTTVALSWLVAGASPGVTGSTLAGTYFSKGQTVQCLATPSDLTSAGPTVSSPSVTVADSPPTSPGVSIAPGAPVEGVDALTCSVSAPSTDADGEAVTYAISWTVGGSAYSGATSTTTLPDDTIAIADVTAGSWVCSVTPTAAGVSGAPGTATVTVSPPPPIGKIVFVTSTLQNGNLGGTSGADSICQSRANSAGLSGTFKAWISGGSYSSSPASRFTRSTTLPYVRVDGVTVANDWADLTDGSIQNAINIDENGVTQNTPSFAWSFTRIDGSQGLFGSPSEDCYGGNCHCNNWTTTQTQGNPTMGSAVAKVNDTTDDWTDYSFGNFCGTGYRLKCFQQ